MVFNRRELLRHLAYTAAAGVLPWQKASSSTELDCPIPATTAVVINFSGPFAFIDDKNKPDYLYVYAPDTTFEHYPVVSSDSGQQMLSDSSTLELKGLDPVRSNISPPAYQLKVKDLSYSQSTCRVGIAIPRPSLISGTHLTNVYFNGSGAATPAPTALKFIYTNVPTSRQLELDGFKPSFNKCQDPVWEMDIRMVPQEPVDPCHKQAIASFADVAQMCGAVQAPTISYGDKKHCHAADKESTPRVAKFGPGHDCQVISVWPIT